MTGRRARGPGWPGRGAALALIVVLLPLAGAGAAAPAGNGKLYEMEVMGVAPDPASGQPVVLLRAKTDKRELSMFIGPFEAQGIALPLEGMRLSRPYTHDLMVNLMSRLNATLKRVVITDLRENTYYALLVVEAQGKELQIDSRPSDAIALALRSGAPILADERVFIRPRR